MNLKNKPNMSEKTHYTGEALEEMTAIKMARAMRERFFTMILG